MTRRRRGGAGADELVLFSAEQYDALLGERAAMERAGLAPAEPRDSDEPPAVPAPPATPAEPPTPAARARGRRGTAARAHDAGAARYATPLEEAIPGASPSSAVAVSTLTQTTKDVLEGAFVPLWVRGEVSDFKAHRNGHWYFTLRDAHAQIKCVAWARDQRGMLASPDDGMQVVALGQVTVYAARGDLQFSVKALEAEGDGLWRKALEQTLRRLDGDGLLDPARRRRLPRYPRRVAVVTSPSGAALHDILAVVRRRCATVEVVVVPAKVQGDGAPEELCAALALIARWCTPEGGGAPVDLVIVGRGGGGREDLWAFNDERVARALAACPVPTVSAVGHEVDVTLCDLVADLRAATPSAAAEAAVPMLDELRDAVRVAGGALAAAVGERLAAAHDRLTHRARELAYAARRTTESRRGAVEQGAARLHALSPLATLGRGYALPRSTDGEALASVRHFAAGMPFHLLLRDGAVRAVTQEARRGAPLTAAAALRLGGEE